MKPPPVAGNPWPDADQFTIEQRRRAEALVVARLIFPTISNPAGLMPVARWIASGQY